ncbi:cytochrome P450 [Artemisia annua]|uniref:Cytochrome P450 n=1 Tax=Artemisia annua TaxID=35608 RepID=A0A2U1LEQ8_ARTAN|nr:cytochrome P450 [Artemisia annua]
MELEIPFFLFLFIVALFFWFTKLKKTNNNLPPQPWKLPFIGHLHHLIGALPHRALGNLAQKLGPIFYLQLGEVSAVVISSPVLAKQVLKTHDLVFADRPKILSAEIVGYNYKDIVFAPYGEYWRQMRKICILELLSAKKVRSFHSVREEESWKLIEDIRVHESKPINLTHKIFTMMNVIATRVAVGSRFKDQRTLLALIEEIIALSGGFDVSDLFPSFKLIHLVTGMRKKLTTIHDKIDKMFDSIILDHQEQRRPDGQNDHNEDLLDVLLRLKDEGAFQFPLTLDHIKAVLVVSDKLYQNVVDNVEY